MKEIDFHNTEGVVSRRRIRSMSLATLSILLFSTQIQGLAPTPPLKAYDWIAQFIAADASTKTVTVKTRIPGYVSKYIDRFKPGDRVMLVWDMLPTRPEAVAQAPQVGTGKPASGNSITAEKPSSGDAKPSSSGNVQPPAPLSPVVLKTESDVLLAIWSYDPKNTSINTGYVLPAEFVSAEANMVTMKLRVPEKAFQAVESMQPGQWLQATSSMSQPTEEAAVSAVKPVKEPVASTTTK
jgi:hypothetical protein